jgi:hypothetical protein
LHLIDGSGADRTVADYGRQYQNEDDRLAWAFSADGRCLVMAESHLVHVGRIRGELTFGASVDVVDTATGERRKLYAVPEPILTDPSAVAGGAVDVTACGDRIVFACSDTVRVLDAAGRVLAVRQASAATVRWAPDGRVVLNDRLLWDVERNEVRDRRDDPSSVSLVPALSPRMAMTVEEEFTVFATSGHRQLAWFPGSFKRGAGHPSGRCWAMTDGRHLFLLVLEDSPD